MGLRLTRGSRERASVGESTRRVCLAKRKEGLMADTNQAGGADATEFRLSAEGVDLRFVGSERFVEQKVLQFDTLIRRALHAEPAPSSSATPFVSSLPSESFADFVQGKPVRPGRGKIQDRLLLAFVYEQVVRGRPSVSTQDIARRFAEAAWDVPNTLHNHLGILKRKHAHIEGAERRGLYRLSAGGTSWAEGRYL